MKFELDFDLVLSLSLFPYSFWKNVSNSLKQNEGQHKHIVNFCFVLSISVWRRYAASGTFMRAWLNEFVWQLHAHMFHVDIFKGNYIVSGLLHFFNDKI